MRFIFLAVFVSASLSPDIAESSEPVPVGVSQLEGSPMDTSSPASGTQEEPAASSAPPNHMSQELSGSGDSGLTDRQTDAETGQVFEPKYFIDTKIKIKAVIKTEHYICSSLFIFITHDIYYIFIQSIIII